MRVRLLLVVALLVVPLAGCGVVGGLFGADPEDAAAAFLDAFARGDGAAAGQLTDQPAAAAELIGAVREELKPQQVQASVLSVQPGEASSSVTYSARWDLGANREWRYEGRFDLIPANTEPGWAVRWAPAVVHPRLGAAQRLELRVQQAEPAPVVDRTGAPLLTAQTVVSVALNRDVAPDLPAVAGELAAALAPLDERITQTAILDGVAATPPGQRYTVAVLREQDYLSVRDRIYHLPGVTFPTQRRLLGPDRDFAAQLLPGIRTAVEEQLKGAAGWRIVTVDAVGNEVAELAGERPKPAPTVRTTLDIDLQAAAEDAVQTLSDPAMIVAIQPSSGDILAVAQNPAADAQGPIALTGRYPPGSTFKIATAAAVLDSGALTPDSPVPCPATTTIDGRLVPNIDRFDLGTVPLRTAFARSCNTTFARLAADFDPNQLTDAAYRLGIGRDYAIPGITTLTGSVPPSASRVQRAENGFGQGEVLVTPFGMALLASTVAAGGNVPTPDLIEGMATQTATPPAPALAEPAVRGLRAMMREVITQGTGQALSGQDELAGKTGTAEYSATGSHGWFVGFRDDLAFATLVVDAGSSGPAVSASGRFLSAIGSGSA